MTIAKKPVEGTVLGPAAKTALGGIDALTALENLVDGTMDFLRIREGERTKRIEIEAYASTEVTRIKAAESVLKQYFEHVFTERARTIDGLFEHLDDTMTRGDGTAATAALQGIVDLAKSSPLADMGDLTQVRKALDDPRSRLGILIQKQVPLQAPGAAYFEGVCRLTRRQALSA